jgi:hypothetical protein
MTDYYDEDELEELSEEELDALVNTRINERLAHHDQRVSQWNDHVAQHIVAAEDVLGRELSGTEVQDFAGRLAASNGEAIDIGDFDLDMSHDDTRQAVMAEHLESPTESDDYGSEVE